MNLPRQILILLLRVYQWTLSPLLLAMFGPAGRCRFTPSCSQYAVEALQIHGVIHGGALAGRRLCRCHPWGGCGHDPVPGSGFQISARAAVHINAGPDVLGAASGRRG
jgi:putative membrane protein insertion efficiency factor